VRNSRSWLALITFCTTTPLVSALVLAIIFATAAAAASEMTFTGLVTDDHCGARHDMGSGKSPAECAKACVRNGAKYALVDGEKTYTLQGNSDELARASGRRVSLSGSLQGNTIQVRSIASDY